MERYDYNEAVFEDAKDFIKERLDEMLRYDGTPIEQLDGDRIREELLDDAFLDDSVTGNGSGSYTFSTWQAEENLCHNTDLIEEVMFEFDYEPSATETHGAEWWDVSIRCMMLYRVFDDAFDKAIEELEEEFA